MSPHKYVKFPPLTPSQKQRRTFDHSVQNETNHRSEEGKEEENVHQAAARQTDQQVHQEYDDFLLHPAGSSYIYAGLGRKPQLLLRLESYVNKELLTINPQEPNVQELKLQVYREAFGHFIKEFKTYQPLLSAIKKEYENTLAYQRDQIRELQPLRSNLRLVTEECDRKIQARWAEEQAEIGALKREKQQLHKAIEAMREKGKDMQALVEHLQHELSNQYLQYREEHDARKLLIWQLSDLTSASVKEEHPADENTEEAKDPVALQLALKVCREDLAKAQEELNRMKAEYWDVVPRCNWEALEQTHTETLLQMKTLQGDFDQLKSEYDTLLDLQKRSSMQADTHDCSTLQMDASMSQEQSQIQSCQLKEPIKSEMHESNTPPVQEFRAEFPLKSDEEVDVLVTSAQSDLDKSNDIISTQSLNSLQPAESGVAASPPADDQTQQNAVSSDLPASS